MKTIISLATHNIQKKPIRTYTLVILVVFLSFSIFGGSMVVLSMRNGLESMEARLGADIIVVPSSAKSSVDVDEILLQGTTGYFYMPKERLDKIRGITGIEKISPQIFLASLRASCCAVSVQVIGIDQETDFTIQPWIAQRYTGTLGLKDIVVGSEVNAAIGEHVRIYDNNCTVVAQLERTGTGLDTAVYASMDTIRHLMQSAKNLGHSLKIDTDPESLISAVYIKVKEGYSIEKVTNDINIYVRKVEAIETKNMVTTVADSLAAFSATVNYFMFFIWIVAFAILIAAFCLLINERKREFAVLRLIGASRKMLAKMLVLEAVFLSAIGAFIGIALSGALLYAFSGLIESNLGLPFLLPTWVTSLSIGGFTLLTTLIAGGISSGYAAWRLSHVDAGTVLREGN